MNDEEIFRKQAQMFPNDPLIQRRLAEHLARKRPAVVRTAQPKEFKAFGPTGRTLLRMLAIVLLIIATGCAFYAFNNQGSQTITAFALCFFAGCALALAKL